jgi:hypothetical protein
MSDCGQTRVWMFCKNQAVAEVKECDKTVLVVLAAEMTTPIITMSALKALRSLAKSSVIAINVGATRTRKYQCLSGL